MSEKERERLKAKEQRKNPGGALNSAWAQAYTGAPSGGCLVNIGSIVIIVAIILLVRACSN
ncbi:hypothetical protein AEA09_04015 [Lysinibacillus contaminans]|uniref:Uncharacterized protein n=1 Tax=Lysinibacillus contaminans TaxID=1293441 RepID=A0ABR5JYT6_9BACI|nr:DUF6366 family protein [Lysinibacillus contaminans]KOS67804.1 hypothetical protein AEA09_04015 [Lysinibacillus contaminans]